MSGSEADGGTLELDFFSDGARRPRSSGFIWRISATAPTTTSVMNTLAVTVSLTLATLELRVGGQEGLPRLPSVCCGRQCDAPARVDGAPLCKCAQGIVKSEAHEPSARTLPVKTDP